MKGDITSQALRDLRHYRDALRATHPETVAYLDREIARLEHLASKPKRRATKPALSQFSYYRVLTSGRRTL